jgi:hypothetical protein
MTGAGAAVATTANSERHLISGGTGGRDINSIRIELTLLKLSWDLMQYVQDIFGSFRATLCTAIDVEPLLQRGRPCSQISPPQLWTTGLLICQVVLRHLPRFDDIGLS